MYATAALREEAATLLAADATTLAPAMNANKISLVKAPFVANEQVTLAGVTLADFDGSTAIAGATGAQQVGLDPNNNDSLITIKTPAGGWRWVTTGVTNLPQTIYGAVLTDNGIATVLGSMNMATPIVLTAVGQEVDLGTVIMRLPANSIT